MFRAAQSAFRVVYPPAKVRAASAQVQIQKWGPSFRRCSGHPGRPIKKAVSDTPYRQLPRLSTKSNRVID
jgi:hypothetical protein